MTVRTLHELLADLVTVSPDARVLLMTDEQHVTDLGSIRMANVKTDEGQQVVLLTPEPTPAAG